MVPEGPTVVGGSSPSLQLGGVGGDDKEIILPMKIIKYCYANMLHGDQQDAVAWLVQTLRMAFQMLSLNFNGTTKRICGGSTICASSFCIREILSNMQTIVLQEA